jgi:16S rRNA G1207 methylase RsmC
VYPMRFLDYSDVGCGLGVYALVTASLTPCCASAAAVAFFPIR